MKLWLLRPCDGLPANDNPWDPWYDKNFGLVIRAKTEERARQMAQDEAADEKRGTFLGEVTAKTRTPWTDPKYSTCVPLTSSGPEEIIIIDHASA